jgi:hypothetical protein
VFEQLTLLNPMGESNKTRENDWMIMGYFTPPQRAPRVIDLHICINVRAGKLSAMCAYAQH